MTWERDNIAAMAGYVSGEQPDNIDTIKLNTNENPYPPSPAVGRLLRNFDATVLRRYPPARADRFRGLAATLHGVKRENIIATRGGDELLRLVMTTFVDPGVPVGMTYPTYSLYPVLARIQDCPVVEIPLLDDWRLPPGMASDLNAAGVKVTFLVNPHAPSGTLRPLDQVRGLADELNGILLLDEAYVDFVDPDQRHDAVRLLDQCPNMIILRSMSKGYSLAGLRFGYGIGPSGLIEPMLNKTRDSYNVDVLAQEIATAALDDQRHASQGWMAVREERQRLTAAFAAMHIPVAQSQANFLLATLGARAPSLHRGLRESGILVRYFDAPGLTDKLRITVGTPEENDRLLSHLGRLIPAD